MLPVTFRSQRVLSLARNLNNRLLIESTGRDFNGPSTGAEGLSIRIHSCKGAQLYEYYRGVSYSGFARKVGAGLDTKEFYATASMKFCLALRSKR